MFASKIGPTVEICEKLIVVLWRNSLLSLGWGSSWSSLLFWLGGGLHWSWSFLDWFSFGSDLLFNCWLKSELGSLTVDSLLLALSVLGSTGITLSINILITDLLSLELVNGLHKNVFVLELVTLGSKVQLVVDVLVDLLVVTVLSEESTENTGSAHSEHLLWHTSFVSTLSVTSALVAALALFGFSSLDARARVHANLASHDKAILEKFSDVLARVSQSNFAGFIWINPNSLATALQN